MAVAVVFNSYGQANSPQTLFASAERSILIKEYAMVSDVAPPGLRRKKIGTALTIGGAALTIGGIAMVASADAFYYNYSTGSNGSYEEGDPKGAVGILMIAGGVGISHQFS